MENRERLTPENIQTIDLLYDGKYVSLANSLAQARAKTSLLESKLELLAIFRMNGEMKTRQKTDAKGKAYDVHYVEINTSEIRQLIGRKGGSIYSQIESAAIELKRKIYIYHDPENDQFTMDSLYGTVDYSNGKLTVEFNPATEYLFMELKDSFVRLNLNICFKFETNGGFQLYKMLRSFTYVLPEVNKDLEQEAQQVMVKRYSLSELRLQLGYIDLNQPEIKKEGSKKHPDAEKMAALEKKPKYKRYQDFYERVLKPGIKEINETSDIYIAGLKKICSAHGKVDGVELYVQNNVEYYRKHDKKKSKKEEPASQKMTDEQIDDFIDSMREIISDPVKTKDLRAIAEAAAFDMEKIKTAYEIMSEEKEVRNVVGYLLDAITKEYSKKVTRTGTGKNGFKNYEERNYTETDDLEMRLLNK